MPLGFQDAMQQIRFLNPHTLSKCAQHVACARATSHKACLKPADAAKCTLVDTIVDSVAATAGAGFCLAGCEPCCHLGHRPG
jgi:hypothetical protein